MNENYILGKFPKRLTWDYLPVALFLKLQEEDKINQLIDIKAEEIEGTALGQQKSMLS